MIPGRSLLALAALGLAACSSASAPATSPEDQGTVALAVTVHAALGAGTAIPVAAVWVHLQGTSDRGTVLDLWDRARAGAGHYTLSFQRVPVGSYLVAGRAYSDPAASPAAVPDFETVGAVPVRVLARNEAPVALTLQQNLVLHPPDRSDDRAPTVDSVVASALLVDSSDPAATVSLSATASDPDGPADLASFAWSASYAPTLAAGVAPGAFGAPADLATSWSPPAGYEGIVTVVFAATDLAGARSALALALRVSPRNATGALAFTADVNNFPDLGPVLTADAQPRPGQLIALSVIARDPDDDPLSFVWDDGGCGGTFDPQGAATTATTAWRAPAAPAACALSVSVSDGRGGTNRSTVHLAVDDPRSAFGPEFVFAMQSPGNPVPAGPVWFRVEVVEPAADPASPPPAPALAWAADVGGAFDPVTAGDPSWVRWTPPACAAAGLVRAAVTVTATGSSLDPLGNPNRAAFTFLVDLACP